MTKTGGGIYTFSTDTESSQTLPDLLTAARERIACYEPQGYKEEGKFKAGLNAFLDWLPPGGWESIARDINNATTDSELHDVFFNLLTALAIPMKARSNSSTVTESPQANRLEAVETVASTLDEPQYREETFRELCKKRDSYRCIVSGELDTKTWIERGRPDNEDNCYVDVTHIIPFAYASWDKSTPPPGQRATAWEVLYRCFPGVRHIGMAVTSINDLRNGVTLRESIHKAFGRFEIAFKPTGHVNVYERKIFGNFPKSEQRGLPGSTRIELTQAADTEGLELPSVTLLDCHYRLCEILNASGMGEIIEKHWDDWEDLKARGGGVMRPDGSSDIGHYLEVALWERVVG
ncbi:hypothetical protein ASPZODRAFT_160603 [Penicilliopsis zonata CBS 506.65]|uniref:HNH nuclease domain-containing protein n=1 Tax=Penicilliopsis zonata CBS 506.65 TaxID=1073090 RepID=A0A1L9SD89_9EURO|nr:hypothetical protein ASPZODRAFT_160603 [Penicilliopsis zonata CBS 506.65]OJJ45151.1 hypothetical protein ASPZODRAFT_160603 [Penicilliopsis zonata CBS 506.65]